MTFDNVYEDRQRAESYARLEFPGTYYLAYRDLPQIIMEHVTGKMALDFGCGTGRSTRFLKNLGFDTIGVDISDDMLGQARARDEAGDYRLVDSDGLGKLNAGRFNLILSAFTFDNIPTAEQKINLFTHLGNLLETGGKIINLVSSPQIYLHEWASFTTLAFPENHRARSGDKVKIIMTDVDDRRPVIDILWSDASYRDVYEISGLNVIEMHEPLAHENEPYQWVNETRVAPWVIYLLGKK